MGYSILCLGKGLTVWVVIHTDYDWGSGAEVDSVFSSEEGAEIYISTQHKKNKYHIEEWEVDRGNKYA